MTSNHFPPSPSYHLDSRHCCMTQTNAISDKSVDISAWWPEAFLSTAPTPNILSRLTSPLRQNVPNQHRRNDCDTQLLSNIPSGVVLPTLFPNLLGLQKEVLWEVRSQRSTPAVAQDMLLFLNSFNKPFPVKVDLLAFLSGLRAPLAFGGHFCIALSWNNHSFWMVTKASHWVTLFPQVSCSSQSVLNRAAIQLSHNYPLKSKSDLTMSVLKTLQWLPTIQSMSQGPTCALQAPTWFKSSWPKASSPSLLPMSLHSSHIPPTQTLQPLRGLPFAVPFIWTTPSPISARSTPHFPHAFTQKLTLRDSLPILCKTSHLPSLHSFFSSCFSPS